MSTGIPYHDLLDAARRDIILTALDATNGNRTYAARRLGIQRAWLSALINRLGLRDEVNHRWPVLVGGVHLQRELPTVAATVRAAGGSAR